VNATARSQASAGPPLAQSVIALDTACFEAVRRSVELLFRVSRLPGFQARVDADASATALHRVGNAGVFMGYDFHVTADGPKLIEINTNAGGALINGLHTASRLDPARVECLCRELLPVEAIEQRIVGMFRSEYAAARPGAALGRVAIVDEKPEAQFLRAEFELLCELLARFGIETRIADTQALVRGADGLALDGFRPDLVYLRDTDFQLETPRTRALRAAWLADEVVVTPSPREHHLLADKRRLVLFSSYDALRELGVGEDDARFLAGVVPETHALATLGAERAWASRREWVFKPSRAFGSRAVYRGDKLTRSKLEEILAAGSFVAQRAVAPGEVEVVTSDGLARMKFDVRAYAHRDQILLLGARVYQGQVTNMRTPGGGFSAICVRRDAA
jgi:hypothetical protein